MAIIKSHGVQINTDPRKTLIWKKTLPWELFDVFEKTQIKNCYRKVFHHGQSSLLIHCQQVVCVCTYRVFF